MNQSNLYSYSDDYGQQLNPKVQRMNAISLQLGELERYRANLHEEISIQKNRMSFSTGRKYDMAFNLFINSQDELKKVGIKIRALQQEYRALQYSMH